MSTLDDHHLRRSAKVGPRYHWNGVGYVSRSFRSHALHIGAVLGETLERWVFNVQATDRANSENQGANAKEPGK